MGSGFSILCLDFEDPFLARFKFYMLLSITISLGLFLVIFLTFRISGKDIAYYYFDPQDEILDKPTDLDAKSRAGRTFEPQLRGYADVAKVVIGLAVGSIALLSGYISYVWQKVLDETYIPSNLTQVQHGLAAPLLFFASCVVYLVLFLAFIHWRYFEYLYDRKNYTPSWFSLITALGFSGLSCFCLGYFFLIWSVLHL